MEKVKIVGTRAVQFSDQKDGRQVCGVSFYYTMHDDRVEGLMAGKLFVGEKKLVDLLYVPRPGQDCWVDYDRYGKVSRFELVQESK